MERYADKIPEVLCGPINQLGDKIWLRLDKQTKEVQEYMIYLVLNKFILFFNGEGNIFGSNKSDLSSTMHAWNSGLCDMSVKCILNGLYRVLAGNTEYQKWPPSSPMAFHSVCKHAQEPVVCIQREAQESLLPDYTKEVSSKEYAAKFLAEIKKMTRAARPRYSEGL
jgi:hypothetical protein